MKEIYILLLALTGSIGISLGQVTGTVTDAKDDSPIPGVSVLVKGTGKGTITDFDGKFSLAVKAGEILQFSFIGYATQEFTLGEQTNISIKLREDVTSLSEVVVTALGVTKTSKSLGYVTQSVNAQQLVTSQDVNLINNLQGRLAGVTITDGGAGVGSTSRIVIRGANSFSSTNQPLFVVDGVPINNETTFNNTINNNPTTNTGVWEEVDWGNGAAEFNPSDAESITVLKSAAASALYGIRAANGAIVINTKKYDSKEKGKWHGEISTQYTLLSPLVMPGIQNQFGQGDGTAPYHYVNGSGSFENNISNWGLPFSNSTLVQQFNSPVLDGSNNVIPGLTAADLLARGAYPGNTIQATPWLGHSDNYKNFLQTGTNTINNISLGTTTDNGSYRFSFSNQSNKGVFPNTDLNRYQFSVRAETRLSEKLKTNYYLGYINSSSDNRPNTGYGSESIMYTFFGVAGMPEDVDISSLKNKWWQTGQEGYQQYRYWANHDNPYVTMYENTNSFKKNRLLGNASIKYDITPELNVMVRSGLDFYNDHREGHRVFSSVRFPLGGLRTDDVTYLENNTDFLVNYTRRPSSIWNWNASIGGNRFYQSTYYIANVAQSLIVPGLYNFSNASVVLNPYEQRLQKLIYSGYAFGELSYKNWIFLNLTARNDVSSTLPKGHNSFLYPSAALSAVLSDVIRFPQAISFLKLRASAAQVGRDATPYSINNTYISSNPFNGSPLTSGNPTLANSNLKPSISTMQEVGFDLRFLDDRLGVDFAYYNSDTKNEIVQLPVPASSGYTASYANGGAINSKGYEIVLSATPFRSISGFSWDMTFNLTHYISVVTALPAGVDSYNYFNVTQYGRTPRQINYFAIVGQKLGNMYGNTFIRNNNGDIIYSDGVTPVGGAAPLPKGTPEFTQTNDQLLGNYNPNFILTWSNTLRYKNFSLNMLWDWHHGGVIYSYTRLGLLLNGQSPETTYRGDNYDPSTNTGTIVGKGVLPNGNHDANGVQIGGAPNTNAVPFYTYYNSYYSAVNHEPAMQDASYLKLRQLQVGYTLRNIIKENPSASLTISLVGRNLLLFTPAKDIDPETLALRGQVILPGIEFNNLPSMRQYGFSVSFKY